MNISGSAKNATSRFVHQRRLPVVDPQMVSP